MKAKFYVTTPIYYVNGAPHIGHAYSSVAADVLARWKRLEGHDVFFLTGTDEHGQKVEKAAQDAGLAPQEFADRVSVQFQGLSTLMGLSNDDFIRTTEDRHKRACQALWRRLQESGDIYLGHYEGFYAVRDEAFYGEDELVTRPDGTRVGPTGAPVEWVREPSYFFRLSAWQDRLLALYESQSDFISPASRRSEVLSFVRGGLRDLSVSRTSFAWGVPVPDDPSHVMYVWLDALTNYLSAVGFPDTEAPRWPFWPADVHVVGKDIIRFHAVYWPAFLMAAGLPVPRCVFSNGWWTADGEKISKSLGNAVDADRLVATFGLDPVRYFLLREVPFGNDGDYSDAALIRRLNVELANDLGNLAQRTLSQVAKNCGSVLPTRGTDSVQDRALLDAAAALPQTVADRLERLAFHDALEDVWKVIRAANAYIDHQAPWALRKTDPERMEAVLSVLIEVIRGIATVLQPFMPGSMAAMLDQVGAPVDARGLNDLLTPLPPGLRLPPPEGVFPRYVSAAG
ncbi:MAG: methionine--tRNA ligase [Gemmatimonadaceae bacterium]|nr:methionine--tRNA ligase [Acetobacteraceae bacterium]